MADADTRYFPDVVDRIVTIRDDAEPGGRVVVVSGTPDSGRSTVLRQVAADLRQAGFRVVRREVRGGVLQMVDAGGVGEHVVQGAKVLAAVLQVVGVGVGNLIALAAEIATTYQMVDGLDPRDVPDNPYVHVRRVADAVEQRAAQEPLVLVIDDADKLDDPAVWWDGLFGTSLPRLAARLPVLVVLGVTRTSTVKSHALDTIDKRLLPADLADEIALPRLDPARIVAALGPVDDALLGPLRSLVQGHPSWLQDVWRTWREQGVVVHRDGRWTVAPDARDRVRSSLHGWLESALLAAVAPDSDAFYRAKEILETAALEGPRFTVEALADVLGRDDVDELIDWIDDHLADGDSALLVDDGFVEPAAGVEAPELRCYRFRSAMVAGVLRQETLAGTNGKVLARKYAHVLARVYRSYPVSDVAWTISRLAKTAGDAELVEYVWRRANRLEGVEAVARLARFLVEHLDVATESVEELAAMVERLNGLTIQLLGQWNTADTLDLCCSAERAAQAILAPPTDAVAREQRIALVVDALHNVGGASLVAGDAGSAVDHLRAGAELSTGTSDHGRTAMLYRSLANAELIGWSEDRERVLSSRRHATTALEHAGRETTRVGLEQQVAA